MLATRLHRDHIAKEVLDAVDEDTARVEIPQHRCRAADIALTDGILAVVVASEACARRDNARRTELVGRADADLLALEQRVREGRLKDPAKIGRAAPRIGGAAGVGRLFDLEIAQGRFSYHYNHHAHTYEQLLAGRYVLTTSISTTQATTTQTWPPTANSRRSNQDSRPSRFGFSDSE